MTNQIPPTKRGYNFLEVSSAMQKAIRRSNEWEALYWGTELEQSGYGGYVWKRLLTMVSEDIGMAEPTLAATLRAVYENWQDLKKKKEKNEPEKLMVVHGIILCARAKKSRAVDNAKIFFYNHELVERIEIPDEALDQHTLRGYQMGRRLEHFANTGSHLENVNPDTEDPYYDTVMKFLVRFSPDLPYRHIPDPGVATQSDLFQNE